VNLDQPESVRCDACGAFTDEPCFNLDQMITVNGVTRRAVHAARYAANLPPEERAAFWQQAVEKYFAENPEEK
jgi:hypothetical protein